MRVCRGSAIRAPSVNRLQAARAAAATTQRNVTPLLPCHSRCAAGSPVLCPERRRRNPRIFSTRQSIGATGLVSVPALIVFAADRDAHCAEQVGSCGSPLQGQCYHDSEAIIEGLSGLSMDACCAQCAANTTCAAWTHWITPDGGPHCNLFGAVGNAEPCQEGASGLGPAAPPPSPPPPPPAPPCKDCPNILLMFTDVRTPAIGKTSSHRSVCHAPPTHTTTTTTTTIRVLETAVSTRLPLFVGSRPHHWWLGWATRGGIRLEFPDVSNAGTHCGAWRHSQSVADPYSDLRTLALRAAERSLLPFHPVT